VQGNRSIEAGRRKRKVALLTFSDDRKFAHDMLRQMNFDFQNKLRTRLEATGEYEAVAGDEVVWHPEVAARLRAALVRPGS
jgi:L-fucose isomerase